MQLSGIKSLFFSNNLFVPSFTSSHRRQICQIHVQPYLIWNFESSTEHDADKIWTVPEVSRKVSLSKKKKDEFKIN
jgi:hypothetical protein